jgi:hypothetical protein
MVGFILISKWSSKLSSIVGKLVKNIADKKAVDALIPILKENGDVSRFYESLTSWMIYNPHSVDLYLDASIDKEYFIRYMAAKALVNIGTAPAINALIKILENGDESKREIAATVLGDSKSECVITVLVNAEKDSNEAVHKAARKSLMKLKSTDL